MPANTRLQRYITPPPGPSLGKEADTVKKTRFFEAYDRQYTDKSMNVIVKEARTTVPTGRR